MFPIHIYIINYTYTQIYIYIMYRNGLFIFILYSLVLYFYSWPWIRLPPKSPSCPYRTTSRARARYSTRQVIYSLSGRPSRNWKIHPGTRDKTGHIHGSVWFPNLCVATKTSSEIYYCGRDPPLSHHLPPTFLPISPAPATYTAPFNIRVSLSSVVF